VTQQKTLDQSTAPTLQISRARDDLLYLHEFVELYQKGGLSIKLYISWTGKMELWIFL